ncbi:MAG: hypothetical protein QME70_09645 [Bacillota bacterium]|nr:hypothetical protein [Bacillota bacterium]
MAVDFRDLLDQAAAKGGVEWAGVEAEKRQAEARVRELEEELVSLKRRLAELESALQRPVREAIKAAEVLGIPVPAEYLASVRRPGASGNSGNGRPAGAYLWEANGKPGFQCEVSRAMWRLSKGSGGTAGAKGEGVLSAAEFWGIVKAQTGKFNLEAGESVEVTLPNGQKVKVTRVSPVTEG